MKIDDKKVIKTNPVFIMGLEGLLDMLVKEQDYQAKIGNTYISYIGDREDTLNGKKQCFVIERLRKEYEDR